MEEDLNFFSQMKNDTNYLVNRRQPQSQSHFNILTNGRQPQNKIMQPKTIKIETMVVAPLRVT